MVSARKRREKNRVYRQNRSEVVKASSLVRYQKYSKAYYENNRFKKISTSRLFYAQNCSFIKARKRQVYILNKERRKRAVQKYY